MLFLQLQTSSYSNMLYLVCSSISGRIKPTTGPLIRCIRLFVTDNGHVRPQYEKSYSVMNNFHLKANQNLRIETTELVTTKPISLNKKFSCTWPVGKNRTYYMCRGKSNSTNFQSVVSGSLILKEPTLPVANLDV